MVNGQGQQASNVTGIFDLMVANGNGPALADANMKNGNVQVATPASPPSQQQPPAANPAVPLYPPAAQQQAPATPPAQQQAAAPATPATPATPVAQEFIDTPLGKIPMKKPGAAAVEPVKIENYEQAFATPDVTSILGREVKGPEQFVSEVLPQVKTWRAQATKLGEVEKELNNYKTSIQNLDPDLKSLVSANIEGNKTGDHSWKAMINTSGRIDYSKPVEKVDSNLLINTYFSGKFTPEELTETDNKAVELALDSARSLYKRDQNDYNLKKQNKIENDRQRETLVSQSLEAALSKVNTILPFPVDDAKISQAAEAMKSGQWLSPFLNPDGTWKETAVANYLMASDGVQTLGMVADMVTGQVQSQTNEELVARGDQSKVIGNGGGNMDEVNKKIKDQQNALYGLMATPKSFF